MQRGWELAKVYDDRGVSGAMPSRPGLSHAIAHCASLESGVLVVAKLDRLVRSFSAYAGLIDRAAHEGWLLVALDTPETDTPQGEAMQAIAAIFAQLERRLISQRTREALAVLRAQGVRLGRPPAVSSQVLEMIRTMRDAGVLPSQIARRLEAERIPAPHGGHRWHTSTITRALAK
jgi:DNA invertase Pin-like site-specific DNA recombinase